ncbi:hypothetical protein PC119_g9316 [Phytophthora cactorum]|nr:hypothetical protein PC119_g9316 [Phytophthora cactorum]
MRGPPVRRIFRIPTPSAYSVRVLGADGVGIATLARAYTQLVGVSVLDAERPRPPAHAVGAPPVLDTSIVLDGMERGPTDSATAESNEVSPASQELDVPEPDTPCTYGRYAALMDDEMKSESDDSMNFESGASIAGESESCQEAELDDAIYAFPKDDTTGPPDVDMIDTELTGLLEGDERTRVCAAPLVKDGRHSGAQEAGGTPHDHLEATPQIGMVPEAVVPTSLASADVEMESFKLSTDGAAVGLTSLSTTAEDSDDDVENVQTAPAHPNAAHAAYWLSWFNGQEVHMPDDDQCAILALYATVTNHLRLSSVPTRDVNQRKKAIYILMLANARTDCQLKLLNPFAELTRLYPGSDPPKTPELAVAQLFQHLLLERNRSVTTRVPSTHWASPHILRAYAQYLRQLLLVLDVDAHGDAHAQLYSYRDLDSLEEEVGDATPHESGICTALSDAETSTYLRTCGRLKVLPSFLLLKHQERHFYGVQLGELLLRWQAEGDPSFVAEIASQYELLPQYLTPHPKLTVAAATRIGSRQVRFEVHYDGHSVDQADDSEATNSLLHNCLTMRQRLDVVHYRMGWPILDAEHYDGEDMENIMREEEQLVYLAAGVDEYAIEQTPTQGVGMRVVPSRLRPSSRRRVHEES